MNVAEADGIICTMEAHFCRLLLRFVYAAYGGKREVRVTVGLVLELQTGCGISEIFTIEQAGVFLFLTTPSGAVSRLLEVSWRPPVISQNHR